MIDDWRIQFQSTLAKPFKDPQTGKVIPVGSPLYVSCESEWKKGTLMFVPMPSPISMYLNLAYDFYKLSEEIKHEFNLSKGENDLTESFSEVTDYIENYFASIIFSITSLEAFCNLFIKSDFVYSKVLKGETINYSKEEIERWISLDEKLAMVLPKIYKVKIDKSGKQWSSFKNLYKLRNRIIHTKDVDRTNTTPTDDSIWNKALREKTINPYKCVKDLMYLFFTSSNPIPDWYKNSP